MENLSIKEKSAVIAMFLGSVDSGYYSEDLEKTLPNWAKPTKIPYQKNVDGTELSTRWNMGIFDFHKDWNVIHNVIEYISSLPNDLLNEYFWGDIQKQDFRIFRYSDINLLFEDIYGFVVWFNENKNRYGID